MRAAFGTAGKRARAWGFDVARKLPSTLNTCVIRLTPAHIPLLERWKELLEGEEYSLAQRRPWYERPVHMIGDQDVLTALLSSPEFATLPLVYLRRGSDIVQYFGPPGYTTLERLSDLRTGLPPFVHEQGGGKPWHLDGGRPDGLRSAIDRLYSELSPYRHCAGDYRTEIEKRLSC